MKTVFKPSLIALACFSTLALADVSLSVSTQTSAQTAMSASAGQAQSGSANAQASQSSNTQASATASVTTSNTMPGADSEPADEETVAVPTTIAGNADAATDTNTESEGKLALGLTDLLADNAMPQPALPELPTATVTEAVASIDAASTVANALTVSSQVQGLASGSAEAAQQTAGAVTANVSQAVQQQVQGSATQLVQQAASAEVLQNVNQAVNAEVSNTVRNSLRLTTGL